LPKALVTGGAGFIGSHIVEALLEEDFEVTVVDNLFTGRNENLLAHLKNKSFHFVKGDICNSKLIKKLVRDVDYIFHEAAIASVLCSIGNPILTNKVNVTGTLNLLKACLDASVKCLVYASSSSVYGNSRVLPTNEDLACSPISPFAVTKSSAENYCRIFYELYGIKVVSLRYFNVYGPRQEPGTYGGVIANFINSLLNEKPPVIYGDGEQTRDFTNVRDVVEANLLASNCKSAVGEAFNIATGKATTINRLARMLLKIANKTKLEPVHINCRLGDVRPSL